MKKLIPIIIVIVIYTLCVILIAAYAHASDVSASSLFEYAAEHPEGREGIIKWLQRYTVYDLEDGNNAKAIMNFSYIAALVSMDDVYKQEPVFDSWLWVVNQKLNTMAIEIARREGPTTADMWLDKQLAYFQRRYNYIVEKSWEEINSRK